MVKQNPKIVISEETKKKLDKLGSKGDTYEDIILRLIKNDKL
jgi:predicted CopG family antitoxin